MGQTNHEDTEYGENNGGNETDISDEHRYKYSHQSSMESNSLVSHRDHLLPAHWFHPWDSSLFPIIQIGSIVKR